MAKDNSPARGMRDFLPAQSVRRSEILATIIDVYKSFGFEQFETPVVEDIARLKSGGNASENQKLIYEILKRGLDSPIPANTELSELVDFGLRFDLTVPLARFYANNQANLRFPFRALQAGPVFRAERPQKGRYRQFMQCDIDIVGDPTPMAEALLIEASTQALTALGIPDMTVRVSDRRVLNAILAESGISSASVSTVSIILDKLDKIGWEGVQQELADKSIASESITKLVELVRSLSSLDSADIANKFSAAVPSCDPQVIADLEFTINACARLKSDALSIEFDPSLVRGMGYYTGQIIEITTSAFDSTIVGGGRYDNLIGDNVGKEVPAVGISIGFERILDIVGESSETSDTVILYAKDVDPKYVLDASRELRSRGMNVSAIAMTGAGLGKQLLRMREWGFSSYLLLLDTSEPVDSLTTKTIE